MNPNTTQTSNPLLPLSIQTYPNPFHFSTTLKYTISEDSDVSVDVYNIKGQIVKDWRQTKQKSGEHSLIWDGKDNQGTPSSSGIYFIRINAKQGCKTIKSILIK